MAKPSRTISQIVAYGGSFSTSATSSPDYGVWVRQGHWSREMRLSPDRSAELERFILQLFDEQIEEDDDA